MTMDTKQQIQPAPAEVKPICPSCKAELDHLWSKPMGAQLGLFGAQFGTQVLMCPHCRVWLGQLR